MLSTADHPGYVITPVVFNGDNYGNWSRQVLNALRSKNKLAFVNGTLTKDGLTGLDLQAWEKFDSMVTAWLNNVINPKFHLSISFAKSARAIWVDLEERYFQGNTLRIHQLKGEITLTKQGDLSVTDYFTKLKALWDELETYEMPKKCSCECKCGAEKTAIDIFEREKVHKFLMGLDSENYKNVRSNILGLDSLPNLNKVYASVLREEKQRQLTSMEEKPVGEGSAFKATTTKNKMGNLRPKCSHCQNWDMRSISASNLLDILQIGKVGEEIDQIRTGIRGRRAGAQDMVEMDEIPETLTLGIHQPHTRNKIPGLEPVEVVLDRRISLMKGRAWGS